MSTESTPCSTATHPTSESSVLCGNLLTTTEGTPVRLTTPEGTPLRLTPTGKISHAKTRVYTQRYRKEWEQMSDFKGWLTCVPFQQTRAYCLYCKKNLHAHRLSLLKHTCTMKHQRAALGHEVEEKKTIKSDFGTPEVGLVEEVETVGDSFEAAEENEEDGEFLVERLDDEDMMENQEMKTEDMELANEVEGGETVIDKELCAQLESDDEDSKSVIKKIKLMQEDVTQGKCRDTLAEAMAHVHSEYLEEEEEEEVEVEDHEGVQMEMLVQQPTNVDESEKSDRAVESSSLPILNTIYQTNVTSASAENAINFVPLSPNLKTNPKTVTLTCGSKTFTLSGGTFQPGTQYILTKLKGKSATLVVADQKKPISTNELDKSKTLQAEPAAPNVNQPTVAGTSQQPVAAVDTNQSIVVNKKLPSKKISVGKVPAKHNASKKLRISTYVVDNTKGLPISGLQVSLYKLMDGKWTFLNESNTNINGFCIDLVEKVNCTTGRYKLHFDVDKYFTLRRIETMFPFVEVIFDVKNPSSHYHLPLLLSPFSYTIHRGT